jgi:putative aldouronate transport system permease protein
MGRRIRESAGRKAFNVTNGLVLASLTALCIIPFINVIALSFSDNKYVAAGLVTFWPKGFNFDAYNFLFHRKAFWQSFLISVIRLISGTALDIPLVLLTAYPLSKESARFRLRTAYVWFFFITMLVGGGMIPSYLLVMKLGLRNNILALILPGAVHVFDIVLMINFFRQIPKELEEAALIDGAGHFTILAKVFVPCSLAAIATISLFCMVGHWNEWFAGMIYMQKPEMKPLQTYLRSVVIDLDMSEMTSDDMEQFIRLSDRSLRGAQIIIAMIPILSVYPFLQRYFVKGIVLGSVKG